jgi:hypothetical protein
LSIASIRSSLVGEFWAQEDWYIVWRIMLRIVASSGIGMISSLIPEVEKLRKDDSAVGDVLSMAAAWT